MFDPDFFTIDQYKQITNEFYKFAKKKRRPVVDQDSMKKAIKNLNLIPSPTTQELDAMCSATYIDLEEFFIIIFWYLRGFGTRNELIQHFRSFDTDQKGVIPFSKLAKALQLNPYRFTESQIDDLRSYLKVKNVFENIDYVAFANKIRAK